MRINGIKCSIIGGNCSKIEHIPSVPIDQIFYSYNVEAEKDQSGHDMKELIKHLAKKEGYELYTFRHKTLSRDFPCDKICLEIRRSAILVADVSWYSKGRIISPNVAYEVGLAHGAGTDVILVTTKDPKDVPSNLKSIDTLKFPNDFVDPHNEFSKVLHMQKLTTFPEIEVLSDALSFQKSSKQLEELPKERMFVSSYIPSMTREKDLTLEDAIKIYPFQDDLPYLKEYVKLINERYKIFERNLSENRLGCREIYCKKCIELYANKRLFHPWSERKDPDREILTRIKTLIDRLEKHSDQIYSIRLLDKEPPHKFFYKKNSCVIVDTPTRRISKKAGGVITTIQPVVETYEKIFEDLWKEGKDWNKERVKDWLVCQYKIVKDRIEGKNPSK